MVTEEVIEQTDMEAAYRRGWQQGSVETTEIILHLMQQGYDHKQIRKFLAVFNDQSVAVWRQEGNLEKREPPPDLNLQQIEAFLETHRGYDWLDNEP